MSIERQTPPPIFRFRDRLSFLLSAFPPDQMMSEYEKVEEVNGIANGGQESGLQASVLNKDVLGMNYYGAQFGTKETPAIVQSWYNRIIVGCPGGVGVSKEHDMVWFWLEKDKPHECTLCSQFFQLEVVGIEAPEDGNCKFNDHR
uniref:Cytochrome c oxidase subunit Vb n=1 Tax=Kalanchoe fedtschenkoi TaxID=63787 RepID=A0A7N0U893_KALFE